ncbi:unnamed protein product, partial [Tuber aestivum]
DHFAPHPTARFEGYYTRILTPEATILLILSSVRKATHKPHYVHFSYLPHPSAPCREENLRIDLFPTITDQWLPRAAEELSSPEGALGELVHLLPIHWHVFSVDSRAEYRIRIPGRAGQEEINGIGRAHIEKCWGAAFPSGWTWAQAFSPPRAPTPPEGAPSNDDGGFKLSLAGGQTLLQKAYLLSYASPTTTLHFKPPFSLLPLTLSTPFCSEEIDSRAGLFKISVANFTHKIVLAVKAPEMHRGWIGLHCPLSGGHGNVFAYESFEGVVEVCVFRRVLGGWGYRWREVERSRMDGCALEFGGGY